MSKINFCHISPTAYLESYTKRNGAHLILAHLVESNPVYRDFYANLTDGKMKIMDNGAFEMYKAGRPMYESEKLIEMAHACKADFVVMSDYPRTNYKKTIRAATESMDQLISEGFMPFFCPQTEVGDMTGLVDSIEWAIDEQKISLIGISILNAPIACGVEIHKHITDQITGEEVEPEIDTGYKMQRFLSRWNVFRELERRGSLRKIITLANKRPGGRHTTQLFHMLGMVDGPNEIDLVRDYHDFIFSWDSSAAVWAGMNGIEFDASPTGLRSGKFEKEVDFDTPYTVESMAVHRNISYINKLCEGKR